MSEKIYEVTFKINDKIHKDYLTEKIIESMMLNSYKIITFIDIKEV